MKDLPGYLATKITSRALAVTSFALWVVYGWHETAENDNLKLAYAIIFASIALGYAAGKLVETCVNKCKCKEVQDGPQA